jgi:hypothetical protein
MTCRSRGILTAICFLFVPFTFLTAQTPSKERVPKVTATHQDWTASQQELFAPYWTLEPGWNTELEMRNNVPWHDLRVTPVLRTAGGEEVPLTPVNLKPEEIVSVNLLEAVNTARPALLGAAGAYGSVVFRFQGTAPGNGFAAAMVRREGHPIEFHFDAEGGGSSAAEGMWWLPSETSTAYLILSNPTNEPVTGKLVLFETSGTSHVISLAIGPRQSLRKNIHELLPAAANGDFGGLSLSSEQPGGLSATEIVFDEVTGLSTIMKLFDRQSFAEIDKVDNRVLRAPMMALNQPDPGLGFPAGTALEPKIFLRNAGSLAAMISPGIHWRSENASGTLALPQIKLLPGQMKILNLAELQKTGQIPSAAEWATVNLGHTGRSGDLVAVAMSYDKSSRYGLQTPFSEIMNRLFKGSMWHVDSSHNTLMTTGNGGAEPTRAQVTLFYNGGQSKYRVEKLLAPGQQIWLNLAEVLRNQVPDSDGKTIPADTMFGSYELRDLDHPVLGLLYEGKLVIDKTYGHAAYGCAHCCGYSKGQVSPTPFSGPPGIDNMDTFQALSVCNSQWEDFDFATNWKSSNLPVATLASAKLHTVAPGGATGSAKETLPFQANIISGCPNAPIPGNQGVTVIALPTNFRQTDVQDAGGGNLKFTYEWDSNTGNLDDLSQCSVREYVTYPGTGNYNWTSPPYDTSGNPTANPTVSNPPFAGTDGGVIDNNLHPGFLKPYVANQFTASQKFQYSCTNYQSGAWQDIPFGPVAIIRTIQNSPPWTYSIVKSGSIASTNLP